MTLHEDAGVEAPEQPALASAEGRGRGPALLGLLIGAVLVAALLLRPQQLLSSLSSLRVWSLVVGVVLLCLLLRRLTRRLPRGLADAAVAAPVVLSVLLLVLTTARATSVDEQVQGLAPMNASGAEPSAPDVVGAAPTGPARVASGELEGIGHRATGTVSLVELPDGQLLLRFEQLDVDPGPDYRVIAVPVAGAEEPGDGVELGPLKASSGNQNYPLPAGAAARPFTALIWCEAFSVPIAAATIG